MRTATLHIPRFASVPSPVSGRPLGTALLLGIALCLLALPAEAEAPSPSVPPEDQPVHRVHLGPNEQARAGIEVMPVQIAAFGDRLRVVGRVVRSPGSTSTVKSILDGRVETIHVAPGEEVRTQSPLITLHSHELHRLQGRLLAAHEAWKLAETRVDAGEQLYDIEGISRLELERRQQEALAASIELDSVSAELEDLGYDLTARKRLLEGGNPHPTLTLRAPDDGVVLELHVQRHSWIQAYEPLLTLGDPKTLELELQIPPDEAGGITAGDEVQFAPVGRSGRRGRARILTRVPQVDPTTRTVTLRAALDEATDPGGLLPGVFVEGTLVRGASHRGPSVPKSAVIRLGAEDVVFVRTGPMDFEARPVGLGALQDELWEITSGVTAGEEVAVAGVFLLKSALVRGAAEEMEEPQETEETAAAPEPGSRREGG